MEIPQPPLEWATFGLVGVLLLLALALMIGILESRSRHEAWIRIATARRIAAERDRELDARERALDARRDEHDEHDPADRR